MLKICERAGKNNPRHGDEKSTAENNILDYGCLKTIFRLLFKTKPRNKDART